MCLLYMSWDIAEGIFPFWLGKLLSQWCWLSEIKTTKKQSTQEQSLRSYSAGNFESELNIGSPEWLQNLPIFLNPNMSAMVAFVLTGSIFFLPYSIQIMLALVICLFHNSAQTKWKWQNRQMYFLPGLKINQPNKNNQTSFVIDLKSLKKN